MSSRGAKVTEAPLSRAPLRHRGRDLHKTLRYCDEYKHIYVHPLSVYAYVDALTTEVFDKIEGAGYTLENVRRGPHGISLEVEEASDEEGDD